MYIRADIVLCDNQTEFDKYAKGSGCSSEEIPDEYVLVMINTISTNFDSRLYPND